MINFISPANVTDSSASSPEEQWPKRGVGVKKLLAILAIVVVVLSGLVVFYLPTAKSLLQSTLNGRAHVNLAQEALQNHQWERAITELNEAEKNWRWAKQDLNKFAPLKLIPWVRRQVVAADKLLIAGLELTAAAKDIVEFIDKTLTEVVGQKDFSYAELSTAKKQEIIQRLTTVGPLLINTKQRIETAAIAIDDIPATGLVAALKEAALPLKEILPLMRQVMELSDVFSLVLPEVVGFPDERVYLLLLQNNDELRPTGGFIGTFGVLRIQQAEIKEFYTKNIYELDAPAENRRLINEIPPAPLAKYLGVSFWYMRDANWSPDYAVSANNVERLYHLEHGPIEYFDGVIAITPNVIEEFLAVIGPITIQGETFTSDNFVETLQFRVEQKFVQLGIPDIQRKEIIGALGEELMAKIFALPLRRLLTVGVKIFNEALNEKHILIYHKNPQVQSLIESRAWAGRVKETPHDYLMVIDANLGALKTDQAMAKSISYQIIPENGRLRARASINYKNQGSFTYKTTRYRTYTRVYAPLGSEFIRGEGMMVTDRDTRVGTVDIGEEFGKTYFGAFIAVEPGAEGALTFEYYLPRQISTKVSQGFYSLLTQKQAGTDGHTLTLDLFFDKKIKSATPAETSNEFGDDYYRQKTDLTIDRDFWVRF